MLCKITRPIDVALLHQIVVFSCILVATNVYIIRLNVTIYKVCRYLNPFSPFECRNGMIWL